MFKTSVFPVPPGAERKVTLRYSQVCRQWDGLTDFLFPLSTAKFTSHPIEEIKFTLAIESPSEIKNIYSPTHAVDIKRPDEKHAVISYTAKEAIPTDDFRLFYDVGKGIVGTRVLSYRPDGNDDGYFMLLASPQFKSDAAQTAKKTVVLALDKSGSMSGEKIQQAKNAAKFVVNNLHEGDLFNLISYDDQIESWKPELQKFNDETRKSALGYIEGIYAGGSTNIAGALAKALSQLQDPARPNFVIFLTDGIPTVGETNEAKLVAAAKSENKVHARIFDFGVGYDVNSRLLDKLARENFGLSDYVRPNEDIERSVAALYSRIASPVMSDVKLMFDLDSIKPEDGAATNRVYPKELVDLFAGEQLVVVGRYKKPGAAKVTITGKVGGDGSESQEQKFDFPANLVEHSDDQSQAFVEKLWAVRRIGEILDQIDLHAKNDELVKELVSLSLKHGIMTPYTSFMADDTNSLHDVSRLNSQAQERLGAFDRYSEGQYGFEQRVAKQKLQNAASPAQSIGRKTAATGGAGLDGTPVDRDEGQLNQFYGVIGGQKDEAKKATGNVRQIGGKAFYRRGDRWVDSAVTADQEKQTTKIKRFSPEYFDLIDLYGATAGKYLSSDEPITVELGGKVYELSD